MSNIILNRFLSKYAAFDFFKEIINIFLYPSDFTISIGNNDPDSFPKFINSFFYDLQKKLTQYSNENKNTADKFIDAAKTILKLRNAGHGLITYSSIDQHFSSTNALIKKLIQEVKTSQIKTDEDFRQKINNITLNIKYFYDFQKALTGMTKIHDYVESLEKPETSPIEAVVKFKEMALQLDADVSTLDTNDQNESSTDYYILSDDTSVDEISDSITEYICNNYSFYNTGLNAYDCSVDGMESSSVHLIASPSNGGKSITLSNLFYRIANSNKDEFTENDAALYITCEDDLIKTTRKFISIFGNYEFEQVRNMYRATHTCISDLKKNNKELTPTLKNKIKGIFKNTLNEAIVKTTAGNLKIIFKYSPENSLSAGDIQQQIKKFEMQGIKIKYLIIDYLDVLKPTLTTNIIGDEYITLGVKLQCHKNYIKLIIILFKKLNKLNDYTYSITFVIKN